jgi:hypothetical protein
MRPPSPFSSSLFTGFVFVILPFSRSFHLKIPFFLNEVRGDPVSYLFYLQTSSRPHLLSLPTPPQPSPTSFCYVCTVWPPECDRFKLPFDFFLANKKGKNYLSGSSQPFKLFIHFSGLIPRFILSKNKQLLSIAYPSNQLPSSHTCVTAPNLKKKRNRNKKGS